MVKDNQEPSTPPSGLTPQAKAVVGFGVVALAILYMLFAPASSPTSPPSEPETAAPKPKDRGPDFVPNGTVVHMVETAPACTTLDNLAKFQQLVKEHDRDAEGAMLDRNECEALMKGAAVTVEDSSVWHMAECVRKPGETECLWTFLQSTDGRFR